MVGRKFKILISYILIAMMGVVVIFIRRELSVRRNCCLENDLSIGVDEIDSLRWCHVEVCTFDPNVVGRDSFLLLGFECGLIDRILHYRKAKGVFRSKKDFIVFCNQDSLWNRHFGKLISIRDKKRIVRQGVNNASYSTLCNVLSGCSKEDVGRLYYWKESHLGLVSWRQIYDLGLFSDEFIKECRRVLFIDKESVLSVDVNVASYEEIRRLPYLSNRDVQALMAYRAEHMGFATESEFFSCLHLSVQRRSFLRHYLSF